MADRPKCPEKLNGYPVLQSEFMPKARAGYRDGFAVIVDRGPEEFGPRYVVAQHFIGDSGWWKGDYIQDWNEARVSFRQRAARG